MEIYPKIQPGHLSTYDSMVVIPAYREDPAEVEATIRSIDIQHGITGIRYGVFIVINNAAHAVDDVRQLNHQTHAHLCTKLEERGHWPQLYGHVYVADLYSAVHAPEVCNVGVARRQGSSQALQLLKPEGVLHSTDADTQLGHQYIAGGQDVFRKKPHLAAATGPLEFVASSPEERERYRIYKLQTLIRTQALQGLHDRGESTALMSGSNMTMRASAYRAAGGFPEVAGAEDTLLSCAIVQSGGKIGSDGRLRVSTAMRVSDRTDPRCGFGQQMLGIAAHNTPPELTPAWSRQHAAWYFEILQAIATTKRQRSVASWTEYLLTLAPVSGARLTVPEAELLASRITLLPANYTISSNAFVLRELQFMAGQRFTEIPLSIAVSALEQDTINTDATGQVEATLDLIVADQEVLARAHDITIRPRRNLADTEIQFENLRLANRTVHMQAKIADGLVDMAANTSLLVPSAIEDITPLLTQVREALPLSTALRVLLESIDAQHLPQETTALLARLRFYEQALSPIAALSTELLAHSKITSFPGSCSRTTHTALQVASSHCQNITKNLQQLSEILTALEHPKESPDLAGNTTATHPSNSPNSSVSA